MTDWKTEITAAAARIEGHVIRTPVATLDGFGLPYPVDVKLEQMQHTGTFKARGSDSLLRGRLLLLWRDGL